MLCEKGGTQKYNKHSKDGVTLSNARLLIQE
jgi:hypothetical protein